MTATGTTPIRALMRGLVDYAGLFPPAGMGMAEAVRQYHAYLAGEDRWALGRFVVPASRLDEFRAAFEDVCCGEREPVWGLSVLGSGDAAKDARAIAELPRGAVRVECVELKAVSAAEVRVLLEGFVGGAVAYVEFAPGEAEKMLPVLARYAARAKIRMGGLTADAIPALEVVADFLVACARAQVPFKATAGLHHAVRGMYALTYEPESARAKMHGYVNVFLAALLAWRGENAAAVWETLAETDAGGFRFGDESVRWLGHDAGVDEIEAMRREFAVSYGSCSFEEPVEEARALGWLR